jgi:serine phosphatase RsbU (regulator of sigma subunit)
MKTAKFFLMLVATVCMGQLHAVGWDELPAFELTSDTPIIFTPKENTLVLADPTGSLTVEDVLKRKDEFKPPAEMGAIDTRHSYWIMQKISSKLDVDKNLRLEGNWKSVNTHVISADGTVATLKPSGAISGYSFLSDIDPARPTSAKVASRESLFSLRRGEALILLSQSKAFSSAPAKYVLRMVDNERFLETRRFGLYVEGALLGILFALMIFGWYSYFANRDRAGLFYGAWISFAFLQVFAFSSHDGFHFTEFIVNANDVYIGQASLSIFFFSIGGYGQVFFYFLFASAYLQIGKYYPKTQKLIYLLIAYFALHFIVNHFVNHNVPASLFWLGNAILPVIAFVMLYKAAIERYRQGISIAMFWLIASIPYFIFRLIFIHGLMGYPSVFSYFPESGISYLLQNASVSQAIGLCSEALVMALAVVSRNTWIQKELAHSIASQKNLVENQNKVLEETVAERTKELAEQHQELDEAHQLVVGSVNYASRLQRGQLPRQIRIDGRFASFATIWEPRDTIGGDLYWLSSSQQSGSYVLAVADCTGHGVPGAMLSLLVSNSLERIYANDTTEDPAIALMSLDHYVRTGLNQDRADSESDDGCDAAVLRIDRDKQTIEFAGAKLGLFQVSAQGEVTRHQGARCSLGYQDPIEDKDKPVVQTIRYQAGDTFAIVTDGLTDQIGGNASIKTSFGYRRIENILKANCISDADYIAYKLKNDFLAWQDNETRRDDLTAVVFKL